MGYFNKTASFKVSLYIYIYIREKWNDAKISENVYFTMENEIFTAQK